MAKSSKVKEPEKSAIMSKCGQYRYVLERKVSEERGTLLYIMLNPSTADAENDDPTIRKCMQFAAMHGYGRIRVVNLFAHKATKPVELKTARLPIGPENDEYILCEAKAATAVVCAWGSHGGLFGRNRQVMEILKKAGVPLLCFGVTDERHPRHPCYLPYKTELVPFGERQEGDRP